MSRSPIRVCHVITQLELGGAQQNTLYTVATLRDPFQASLICGPGGLLDEEARHLPGVPVTFVDEMVRPIRPLTDLAALLRLTRLFQESRPQIVHTHSSKAGILGRLAARLAGVPIRIHTVHGFGFNDTQPAPLRAALIRLERLVAPMTTHFIAVSRANLETGVALKILPPERTTLIRSGVKIAEFVAAARRSGRDGRTVLHHQLGIPEGAPLVGMVACLKPQKSPLDFVDMAAQVATHRPDAVFVMVGDGELRSQVEARVEAHRLGGRFHLLGWRRDIPAILASLDVLVLTSLWEGLPRVLPEAIAAGVPIVATRVDGSADILRHGDTGFLCSPGDVSGLAWHVEQLLSNPDLCERIARRARTVLPEFDIDAMVQAQEGLYQDLLLESEAGGTGSVFTIPEAGGPGRTTTASRTSS